MWVQKSCLINHNDGNTNKYEPRHEISNNVVCATSKGSDQPAHTRSLIRAFSCRLNNLKNIKLLAEHHLELLSLKGGCTCSSESTLVKMPHCWKSQGTALCFSHEQFWASRLMAWRQYKAKTCRVGASQSIRKQTPHCCKPLSFHTHPHNHEEVMNSEFSRLESLHWQDCPHGTSFMSHFSG